MTGRRSALDAEQCHHPGVCAELPDKPAAVKRTQTFPAVTGGESLAEFGAPTLADAPRLVGLALPVPQFPAGCEVLEMQIANARLAKA